MTSGPTEDRAGRSVPPTALRRRATLLAVIGAGGAIGAAARYGAGLAIPPHLDAFPVATFLVNVVGAVILGAVAALPTDWLSAHELTRPAIGTGFCGGLTTFSTFSAEIVTLLQQGRMVWACAAVAAHLFGSLLMTFAGIGTVAWLKS